MSKAVKEGFTPYELFKPFFGKHLPVWSKARASNLGLGDLRCDARSQPLDLTEDGVKDAVDLQFLSVFVCLWATVSYPCKVPRTPRASGWFPPGPLGLASVTPHVVAGLLPCLTAFSPITHQWGLLSSVRCLMLAGSRSTPRRLGYPGSSYFTFWRASDLCWISAPTWSGAARRACRCRRRKASTRDLSR